MKNKKVISLTDGFPNTNSKMTAPLQIIYENKTDEVIKVNAFETFNSNREGIYLKLTSGNETLSMDYVKKYFYENPHLTYAMRIQSNGLMGKQAYKVFYFVNRSPVGEVAKEPAFIPFDQLNKQQFQQGIIDVPYSFLLDGLAYDLEFELLPKSVISITLLFSHKITDRSKKALKEIEQIRLLNNKRNFNFKYIGSFVIENNSDEPKELILLDIQKYLGEYVNEPQLRIYDLFSLNYQDCCDTHTNRNDYFNNVKIYSSGSNVLKQICQPIEFSSGNSYYPAVEVDGNQFQICVNELNIVGEELSSSNEMKVIVHPNTTVIYLFKQYNKITNTSTKNKFYNINVQNLTDESKKVNVIDIFDDVKGKGVLHKVGKNRLSVNSENFDANFMRILFYDTEQFENPIIIKSKDSNDVEHSTAIFPLCYLNEYHFNPSIIDIPITSFFFENGNQILFDLPKKGNGANIILGSAHIQQLANADRSLLFPIWFENNTDEPKEISIENDLSNFKEFIEGVTCKVGIDSSYRELLARIDGHANYVEMRLHKIYSKNTGQITQILNLVDYTDAEKQTTKQLVTQSYFTANQFNAALLSIGGKNGMKVFDLNRINSGTEVKKDGAGNEYNTPITVVEKKQRISFNILAKTKVCFIVSLEKNSIPLEAGKDFSISAIELSN